MGLSRIAAGGEQRGVALLRLGRTIMLRDCQIKKNKKTGRFYVYIKKIVNFASKK